VALSPPWSRPGHDYRSHKRGRESSGSQSEVNKPKVSRKESDTEVANDSDNPNGVKTNLFRESVEKADLVGEATASPSKDGEVLKKTPDSGFIHSVQGTPNINMTNQSSLTSPASPILTKSARNPKIIC
jgi:hypothetical protein